MHPQYRGVAFLLSLGSLPIACGKDKDPTDPSDTGNGPSTASPEETGTAPITSGGTTFDALTTTSDSHHTTFHTTSTLPDPTEPETTFLTNNSTSSTSAEETGGFPDFPPTMNPICQAYADHYIECIPRLREYANVLAYYCDDYIQYGMRVDGPDCVAAIEAAYACLNALPCEDIVNEEGCEAEFMAVDAACPTFQDPPDTDTFGEDSGSEGSTG